jgi:SAM-dependent methyltransferase
MNWEQRYRTGDTPWEKGTAAPPLLEWLGSRGAMQGSVLVPGCGFGNDVRAIAAASPSAQVVGLDISPYAIDQARLHPPAGMETYQLADLFYLPLELTNRFAWVFEHTCFCAIPPRHREDYVRAILCALESRGILLAIFFLNPWDPGEEAPEGGGPPFAVTREELDVLFATDFELIEELKPRTAFPGREGREIIRLLRKRDGASNNLGG